MTDNNTFDEHSLLADIIDKWGSYGTHADLCRWMIDEIYNLRDQIDEIQKSQKTSHTSVSDASSEIGAPEKQHYNVLIATPGRMFHAEYVSSLMKTTAKLNELGITYGFLNKYSSFVPTARELTAIDAWQHDYSSNQIANGRITYDSIFWIDSDIEWSPEQFLKLYNSELDVVSGLYSLDPMGTVAVNFPSDRGVPTRVNKVEFLLHEEPVEVGGVGFGFVRMKAGVFESTPRPWFLIGKVQWSEDSEMRVNVGEDYSWCGQAQRAGYKIMVDPTVKVKHHKETVYEV